MLRTTPRDAEDWNSCSFARFTFAPWCVTSHESAQPADPSLLTKIPYWAETAFPLGAVWKPAPFPGMFQPILFNRSLLIHASSTVFALRDLSLLHILTFPSWLDPITAGTQAVTLGIYRNTIFLGLRLLKDPSLAEKRSHVLHQYDAEWEDFIYCIYKKIQFAAVLSLLDGVAWIPGW